MWLDRIILFVLGVIMLVPQDFSYMAVIIITSAVTAGCLCGYFDKKIPVAAACAAWFVFSLLIPSFTWLWGLMVYELTRQRLYPLYALPAVAFAVNGAMFSTPALALAIFSLALGAALAVKDIQLARAKNEVIRVRDSSIESELVLSNKNKQLEDAQASEIEIATLKERGRIAREIHDNVGHILSRAILQTGATAATTADEGTKGSLGDLNETLQLAMDSIRQSVHGLKDDSFNLQEDIRACMRDFPQYTYLFQYDMSNAAPKNVKYCFAAIIKEAFSNTSKHSDATSIKINVQEHPAFYKLQFADNGTKKATSQKGGIGLENMKERAAALSGTFKIYTQRGFSLHVIIPKTKGNI